MKHQPHIDSLRAIAVLGVIIYHYAASLLPGGFVGVDVFFVISGFLISGTIFRDLAGDGPRSGFTLRQFYYRRSIRILPVLFAILIVVGLAGMVLLLPHDQRQLSEHILGGLFFYPNFVLLFESGYFDVASETKPLLHLWSLGIEEQFYILWPFFLMWLNRTKRRPLPWIGGVVLISLVYSVVVTPSDPSRAFFFPISRVWELALGGGVYFISARPEFERFLTRRRQVGMTFCGFGSIFMSLVSFSSLSPYPGWRALVPAMGTALVIAARPQMKILNNAIVAMMGRWSYSLYLWHWPPVAFGTILGLWASLPFRASMLVCVCIGAAACHYLIENPMRFGPARPRVKMTLVGLGAAAVVIVGLMLRLAMLANPENRRISDLITQSRADWTFPSGFRAVDLGDGVSGYEIGQSEERADVFIGDSNMEQYAPRVEWLVANGKMKRALFVTRASCPPLPGTRLRKSDVCTGFADRVFAYVRTHPAQIRSVTVGMQWGGYFSSDSYFDERTGEAIPSMQLRVVGNPQDRLANELREFNKLGLLTFLVLQIPIDHRLTIESRVRRHGWTDFTIDESSVERAGVDALNEPIRRFFKSVGVLILDPSEKICSRSGCQAVVNGMHIYKDCCHLRASFVREQMSFIDAVAEFK